MSTPVVSPWLGDKRWVYSITFDEALADLHQFAIPTLADYSVPGHLEVVVGQMGEIRNLEGSTYNGFRHMNSRELREMLDHGWGVGNHSWSHAVIKPNMLQQEIIKAKETLENAIGQSITVYCSAGDNTNMADHVLQCCRDHGYLGAMSITDALNRPDDTDLMWLNRTFLHTQGYPLFWSEFDPYRNILHAQKRRGWIIDYLHCPLQKAVHPNKDCSAEELRSRIEAICTEGGHDVWLAKVEAAVDYRYTRRAVKIEPVPGSGHEFEIRTPGLHPAVRCRIVTLELPSATHAAEVDDQAAPIVRRNGKLLLNIDLSTPRKLRLQIDSPEKRNSPST